MSPVDRRRQVRRVGNDLVKTCGEKQFYTVQEVKSANRRQGIPYDVGCWSHATFNSHIGIGAANDQTKLVVRAAYRHCRSNQVHTARVLGITRNTLRTLLKRHRLLVESISASEAEVPVSA